jgi:hypothetical protein
MTALEQHSAAYSERTPQLACGSHHITDRRYSRRLLLALVLKFQVVEEQRGLVYVRREHRRERKKLVDERADRVVLE